MCTVIIRVPQRDGDPVRLLAVRDEDPSRPWNPLGPWWDARPEIVGVRDARAGGAWLAADGPAGRLAVLLNRADVTDRPESELVSRGSVVLDAVAGRAPAGDPRTHGFNLVDVHGSHARVTTWDGAGLTTEQLSPGTHMIAHDGVDDPATARIARWLGEFADTALADGPEWWMPWLAVLERSASLPSDDDRAIIRDNRRHGYPTLSLLACVAEIAPGAADVHYGELRTPGVWNRIDLS
ncbi:NRDE family protein [Microbacterium fluvii]|uniref:NRDE family protein n=1 Tax=Microbacterium fluvii TaxID=415215 RepID=A0ABW2HBY8_9MICO|nr:NRDE family protein [Microbacterium fluvii]MCU4671601.1 NRDE family protein [Microbacterium fluvii]